MYNVMYGQLMLHTTVKETKTFTDADTGMTLDGNVVDTVTAYTLRKVRAFFEVSEWRRARPCSRSWEAVFGAQAQSGTLTECRSDGKCLLSTVTVAVVDR